MGVIRRRGHRQRSNSNSTSGGFVHAPPSPFGRRTDAVMVLLIVLL